MRRIYADYIFTGLSAEPLRGGFVELDDDGTVVSTGVSDDIPEGSEKVSGALIPGMVNAHCHIELSSMWHKFRKGTGMAGFIDQINELRDTVSIEEKKRMISEWM
ncbi:MAG: cytosine deaminase, partial [Candidatus Cryptobacteroides sp.]